MSEITIIKVSELIGNGIIYVNEDQKDYKYLATVVTDDFEKEACFGHTKKDAINNLKENLLLQIKQAEKVIEITKEQLDLLPT